MRLPEEDALAAGKLRLHPGVEVCAAGDGVWLRGPALDPELSRALRGLPGAERFRVDARGTLTRVGKRLPGARLPEGPWIPIASWLAPRPQSAGLAAAQGPRARLAFVRSGEPADPGALLVELAEWTRWALGAPEVRLKPLRFAVSEDDQVLVVGTPLPPVRGQRLVNHEGVLVPAGWTWTPPVDAASLRSLFGAATGDVLLFDLSGRALEESADRSPAAGEPDLGTLPGLRPGPRSPSLARARPPASGSPITHEVIEGSAFVKASRSAVRLSTRGIGDG